MAEGAGTPDGTAEATTRDRLLEVAIALFAAHGYAGTSVRAICDAAGANVAAVNYHFGGKRALYDAALDAARTDAVVRNRYVALDTARNFWADRPVEERLRLYIAMSLTHGFDDAGCDSAIARMMVHEMAAPTPAFHRQVDVSIARVWSALRQMCREILGDGVDEATVSRAALSVHAQCHYPAIAHRMTGILAPELGHDPEDLETLAAQIATVSIAGMRALAEADEGRG